MRFGKLGPRAVRHHHQRSQKGLALTHDHALFDPGIHPDCHFQVFGRDLLAIGHHDDLVEPSGDTDPARRIEAAPIVGVQPAIGIDGRCGGTGILPIAFHHIGTADQQFVLRAEAHLDAGQGWTDARRLVVVQRVHADHRARLREAVPLQHRQPEPDEGARNGRRQCGAATDRHAQTPAQPRMQPAGNAARQHGPKHRAGRTRSLVLAIAIVLPTGSDRQRKNPPGQPAAALQFPLQSGMEGFENARHRDQRGRPDRLQVFGQLQNAPGMRYGGAGHHRQVIAGRALEQVRQRQKRQKHIVRIGLHPLQRRMGDRQDIAVAQQDPLGPAGGPGGIDQRRQIIGRSGRCAQLMVAGRQPPVGCHQKRIASRVQRPQDDHPFQRGHRRYCRRQRLPPRQGIDHQQPRTGIREQKRDVLGAIIDVERDIHQSEPERGLIHAHPVGPIGQCNGNALTGQQTFRHQRRLPLPDPAGHLGPAVFAPLALGGIEGTIGDGLGHAPDALPEQRIKRSGHIRTDDIGSTVRRRGRH